jgi:beta-lactamase regulating signal transducer with metallopeptidase domain
MNSAMRLLGEPLLQRLGWALIHFLWQGAALALILRIALAILRRSSAQARGLAACATLLAMAVAPILTFYKMDAPQVDETANAPIPAVLGAHSIGIIPSPIPIAPGHLKIEPHTAAPATVASAFGAPEIAAQLIRTFVPWVTPIWLLGVSLCLARLFGGWLLTERLKSRGAPITGDMERWVADLSRRIGVSLPVQLLESALAQGPAVIGWLRPVILLPASALSGLSAQELRAILAHELAHIRRYDYLVNLLQCLAETLLFYHPAVWWVSARIRQERENACDDIAAAACGDRFLLARALHALEATRGPAAPLTVAAHGGDLLARIRRLASRPHPEAGSRPWAAALILALCATLILIHAPFSSAQAADKPAPGPSATPDASIPDPAVTFKKALQTLQDEADNATAAAKKDYLAQLQSLLRNGLQAGDDQLAVAAGDEISSVNKAGKEGSEGEGTQPPQILTLRNAYLQKIKLIAGSATAKAQPFLSAYTAWLQTQAAALDARGDTAAAARTRMEWLSLLLRSTDVIPVKTRRLGGGGGGQNTDLPMPYGILVGFKIRSGDFAGHNVITGLKSIFYTPGGTIYGNRRGPVDPEDAVVAADGYAVGGIRANSGDRLDGFEIIFMKIDPAKGGLDPDDSYTSPWFGGHGGGGPTTIACTGGPVIGVFGGNGLEIDSLGLILATGNTPAVPNKTPQPTPAAP